MNHDPARRPDAAPRRGMLMLLVLSILALFVVVGAVGILVSIRARESARAFAGATAAQAASASLARAQLDAALLKLIRGPAGGSGDVTESLLEDKYGPPQSCQITGTSGTTFFFQATVSGLDLKNPATFAGRVLTFVPAAGDPTAPTSYRIARTSTSSTSLLVANVRPTTPLPRPTVFPVDAIINGREFSGTATSDKNEPYDAFDDRNPFLTNLGTLAGSRVQTVARPAFGAAGAPCTVDNDGDGVPDGIWLDNVLPPQRTPDGGQLSFSVSYLVVDLDSRINLNAHGTLVRAQTVTSTAAYPAPPTPFVTGSTWAVSGTIPPGMGYGPADVDASLLVADSAEATNGTIPSRYKRLLQGGAVTTTATVSTTDQWRPTPRAETSLPGRYTSGTGTDFASAGPGPITGLASTGSTGTNRLLSDFWVLNTSTVTSANRPPNSPTDLKGRLQVYTDGSPPALRFVRPEGSGAWATTGTDDVCGSGTTAHPYALRLDDDAPRAAGPNAVDAPFTVAELERVLRSFDADASQLAPRLAALLDDVAERSRLTVTTDSWDTPAITGTAAQRILQSCTNGDLIYDNGIHSPEVVAGLRFNLNRPIAAATTGSAARQEYFRQLYTLCLSLGVPAADAAQWSANVIEFRDPDSIMSWYVYDTNPFDGSWTTSSGTGVWGIERPELVITSASQTGTQLTVGLYRPWNAELFTGTAATPAGTTERIDAKLGNATANTLRASGTVPLSGGGAIWRLVAGSGTVGLNTLISSATSMATNSSTSATLTVSGSPAQVVLQRLADPGKSPLLASASNSLDTGEGKNAYVNVHQVSINAPARTVNYWLHWPNRDLVSHGELLTVPSGSAALIPEILFDETKETSLARTYPLILDATIVPSRFLGAQVSVDSTDNTLRMGNFQHSHFSRWREPGRVNVNTILPNTGNTPATLDNAVWAALVGRGGLTNPASPTTPVQADRDLLVTGSDARFPRSGSESKSGFLKRSTAIRLASSATVRSHVFAVWITLRITDSSPTAGPPQYARLFAIVDRSLPVAYAPGRTLNVRETIRLQRFLP